MLPLSLDHLLMPLFNPRPHNTRTCSSTENRTKWTRKWIRRRRARINLSQWERPVSIRKSRMKTSPKKDSLLNVIQIWALRRMVWLTSQTKKRSSWGSFNSNLSRYSRQQVSIITLDPKLNWWVLISSCSTIHPRGSSRAVLFTEHHPSSYLKVKVISNTWVQRRLLNQLVVSQSLIIWSRVWREILGFTLRNAQCLSYRARKWRKRAKTGRERVTNSSST